MNDIILGDCLEVMRGFADNQFDLVLTDPPYGIGVFASHYKNKTTRRGSSKAHKSNYELLDWDNTTPSKEVFDEIMRVSKHQIIFGGNYFTEFLPPSASWIVWDKENGNNGFADCELAWTSHKSAVRLYRFMWNGMLQGDMKNKQLREHPTQKPEQLMRWCIAKYTDEGATILDPFAGSGTTLRAAKDLNRQCTVIEINPKYVEIIKKRERQEVLL